MVYLNKYKVMLGRFKTVVVVIKRKLIINRLHNMTTLFLFK